MANLFAELAALNLEADGWAKDNDFPIVERYPQFSRMRAIGTELYRLDGFKAMQSAVSAARRYAEQRGRPDVGIQLMEFGWSGIGEWQTPPKRDADLAYVRDVAEGRIDYAVPDIADRIEAIVNRNPGDAEIEAELERAAMAYQEFTVAAAQAVLASPNVRPFVNAPLPTEYQFDRDFIAARVAEHRAALEAREPGAKLEDKAVAVIYKRLLAEPARYIEFGPWWWAVKEALRAGGKDCGGDDDPVIHANYRIDTDTGEIDIASTLTAAEEFRELYQATFFRGTRTFDLGGDIAAYQLVDEDMEMVLARSRPVLR